MSASRPQRAFSFSGDKAQVNRASGVYVKFFQNFDELARSSYDLRKLRNVVFAESNAVYGVLVLQTGDWS